MTGKNMKKITVRLCKKKSDDGIFEMRDHVEIGREYVIYPETIREFDGFNQTRGIPWSNRKHVLTKEGGWLPVELLENLDGTPL